MRKPVLYAAGIVILAIVLIGGWYLATYNGLIQMNENVNAQWQDVEVQYQRRADLIPNLVSTVQGYANFEKSVLTEVTAARSAWTTAQGPEARVAAANQLEATISKLLLVAENYPDLQASQNFLALQDELAGTENRVAVERSRYNDAVRAFNAAIQFFPTSIVANQLGYTARDYFNSAAGAESAPNVSFP